MSSENRSIEEFREPLSEPHFDEEATVLSAKPVVPLSQVKANRKNLNGFALAATIVAGLFVGAFGAGFIYSKRQVSVEPQIEVAVEPKETEAVAESIDTEEQAEETPAITDSAETEAPLNESSEALESEELKEASASEKTERTERPKAKLFGVIRERRAARIERRHAETREERRPRRVKGQQSSNDGQNDLFRIRDIFEGVEQPE